MLHTADEYMEVNAEIGMYFGRLGMGYDFLKWVISTGSGLKLLTDDIAEQFGILMYRSEKTFLIILSCALIINNFLNRDERWGCDLLHDFFDLGLPLNRDD